MLSYNIQNFNQVLNDMNNENINLPEEDFNEGLGDIEQMLKPQCEFKASDTLKDEVHARSTYGLGWLLPVWSDLRCCGSHHQRRRKQTQRSMPIWSVPIIQSISAWYLTRWMHANPSKTSNGD